MVVQSDYPMHTKRMRQDISQAFRQPSQFQVLNNTSGSDISQSSTQAATLQNFQGQAVINNNGAIPRALLLPRLRNTAAVDPSLCVSGAKNDHQIIHTLQGVVPNHTLTSLNNLSTNTMTGLIAPPMIQTNNLMRPNQQQLGLPTYNLQPPPGVFSSNTVRLANAVAPANSFTGVGGAMQCVTVPCVQVRIGSRKFRPNSGVTFKDDGVLFTLKDFTFAPVLINARAITKCKANMNMIGYPCIFIFLENSCMKQIRGIFGITDKEFSNDPSASEVVRCITIFPQYGPELKSQSQHLMQGIKKAFDAMIKKFPRPSPILEEISLDQSIDLLYSSFKEPSEFLPSIDPGSQQSSDDVITLPSAPVTTIVPPNNNNHGTPSGGASTPTATKTTTQVNEAQSTTGAQGQKRPHPSSSSTNQNESSHSGAVPLTIPNDPEMWRSMQKDLKTGGVYHVLMSNGRRSYCLWNGSQLMPCLVQNTEVQLSCEYIRFGMIVLECCGQVRVKAEQANGIYFTVKNAMAGRTEIGINPEDVIKSQIFCGTNQATIFLSLTAECSSKISEKAYLVRGSSSLVKRPYDSLSGDVSRSHVLIFISDLHKDQEDALLNMKFGQTTQHRRKSSPMFEGIDIHSAIALMSEIHTGSVDAGKRFQVSNNIKCLPGYERLVRILMRKETLEQFVQNPASHNITIEDDDDIVMTQEEVGIKCPYTQKVMTDPVRNRKCNHNYEKEAIFQFIAIKKGNARCPYAGCANSDSLSAVDLESNHSLREYIKKKSS